jgi:hypothetical protein
MDVSKALPESIYLDDEEDGEWLQTLDYEFIPFRCRHCHQHGHLFRECPLNIQPKQSLAGDPKTPDGFTKVQCSKKSNQKKSQVDSAPTKSQDQNPYAFLGNLE